MVSEVDIDILNDALQVLNKVRASLRSFLETDDYSFIEEAYKYCLELMDDQRLSNYNLHGKDDLLKNLASILEKVRSHKTNLNLIEHGLLVQQVVYALTRANIMAVGIEFRIKRYRG